MKKQYFIAKRIDRSYSQFDGYTDIEVYDVHECYNRLSVGLKTFKTLKEAYDYLDEMERKIL